MVTLTLAELLVHKHQYDQQYPGGRDTMPPVVQRAYRNLLVEIRGAAGRAQGTLPGLDAKPAAPEGQLVMF
jgi:uncharacterized protein (DUF2126 family)